MTNVEVEILTVLRIMGNHEELSCAEQFGGKALAVTQLAGELILNTNMEHNKELQSFPSESSKPSLLAD